MRGNSLMSEPAQKALVPDPVNTMTRTDSSAASRATSALSARVKRRRGRRGSGESEDGPDRAGIGGMGTTTGTAPFVGERQGSLYSGRRHPTRKDYRIVNVNGPPMGRLYCFTARHRV